jgi:hypothetical protein
MANPTSTYKTILDRVAQRAHKIRTRADEELDVQAWTEAAIERVENELPWNYLRAELTISLVADQYLYDMPDLFRRIDAETLRYGGEGTYLKYERRPERIDGQLGPQWRDSSTSPATPLYWCEFGQQIMVGPKPSSEFIATNPTLYGYGWKSDLFAIENLADKTDKTEVDALTLMIPLWLRELFVVAALAEGLQQEDDREWADMENKYEKLIVRYRGDKDVVQINTRPDIVAWAHLRQF